ncbi:MAG: Ig domain-containing protein [Terriglobales bacterium]
MLGLTTTSVPDGEAQTAYKAALTASGGTAPYHWSIASGQLAPGLALDAAAGQISGTPTSAGTFAFTVAVSDSSSPAENASQALKVTIAPALAISTNTLYEAPAGSVYRAVLTGEGGVPPYTWSVASGQLPPGLTLDAKSGQITGTASQAGAFAFTVQVRDSLAGTPATTTSNESIAIDGTALDAYGGAMALACPQGAAAHFYTSKIGNRWYLCTPAGHAFWLRSVYTVDVDDSLDYAGLRYKDEAIAKYGDSDLTWGPQQNRRLLAWGFNGLAEYSSIYVQATTANSGWPNGQEPVPVPFIGLIAASHYTQTNEGGYASGPVKDLMAGLNPKVYSAYSNVAPDIWDPNYVLWIENFLQKDPSARQWLQGPNNSYLIGLQVDETDTTFGFGAGGDFPTMDNGQPVGGKAQPNLGWVALVTSPTQTSNSKTGVTYTDTTVYTKQALMQFLEQRYGTIQALDSAWGANYTTFGSAGGWGSGTGLLDEDGTHAWVPKDFINLHDGNAAIDKDLNDFLLQHATKYFSEIKAVLAQYAPGVLYMGPTVLGSWGAPPRAQVLQGAGPNIDVVVMGTVPAGAPDDQQRVDFIAQNLGDKPWLEWEGFVANPDSYFFSYPSGDATYAPSTTQAARGQEYQGMVSLLLHTHTSAGSYPIVGFKWWQYVDNPDENLNWGLVTRRDNEYDGHAASTAGGHDAWGYATGGEAHNYGDFLSGVEKANWQIWATLLAQPW